MLDVHFAPAGRHRFVALPFVVSFALLLAREATPLVPPTDPRVPLLAHDPIRPLALLEEPTANVGAATTVEISFDGPSGERATGRLFLPPGGETRHPLVLFVHGAETDRTEFIAEASMLSKGGTASFLYDIPSHAGLADAENERLALIRSTIELRHVVDLLSQREGIDPSRIGFVGRGFGAQVGAILAGVEPRISAFCLVSVVPNLSKWAMSSPAPEAARLREKLGPVGIQKAARILAPFEAENWLRFAAPSDLLFQIGRHDPHQLPFVSRELESIASLPRAIRAYDGGPLVDSPEAIRDRLEWLIDTIGVSPYLAADLENRTRLRNPFRDPVGLTIAGMRRVDVQKNRLYKTTPNQDLELDVYRPAGVPIGRKVPAVILVPGEAPPDLMKDAKDWGIFRSYGELLAASGLAAVPINHRSWMRQAQVGEAMSDVLDAVQWIRDHANELGVDRDRIAFWAFSGATNYSVGPQLRDRPSWLRAVVASYGPLHLAAPSETSGSRIPDLQDELITELSPTTWLRKDPKNFPPMLIVRGARDPGVKKSTDDFLAEAERRGIPIELLEHPTGGHAFDVLVPGLETEEVIRRTLDFLKARLLG